MASTSPKDKAVETIRKLTTLADHPNTSKEEADAARGRIAALREKHNIPEPVSDWGRRVTDQARADELKRKHDEMRRFWEAKQRAERERKQAAAQEPRCSKPETFFDSGGIPRKRNQHVIQCERCGRRLQPGEGSVIKVGNSWHGWCTETKPGPRKKRW
jgi:hypothetical protein